MFLIIFDNNKNSDLSYELINKFSSENETELNSTNSTSVLSMSKENLTIPISEKNNLEPNKLKEENKEEKKIFEKLKDLQINLHNNNISDKKSACFWCTYEFDNPPIYIPKNEINGNYNVYGCFCSPECATAHLMNENINTSIKFERYYLLNHIYAKII